MKDAKQQDFLDAYKASHDGFVRYCSALAFGKMDVEDLMQDVLVSAYQHFDTIKDKDNFKHYLIKAARNRSISIWRKKKFNTDLIHLHEQRLVAKECTPEQTLDIQFLYRLMDQLPAKMKEAIILFEISGYSIKEIAKIQSTTEGAIKTSLSRARKKLYKLCKEESISMRSILGTLKLLAL